MMYTTINTNEEHIATVFLEETKIPDYRERLRTALEEHYDAQIIFDDWAYDLVSYLRNGKSCMQKIIVGQDNQETFNEEIEIRQTWLY